MTNWRNVAAHYARVYHLPAKYFVRQINQESGFRPHISSRAGAQGIAQIMPATARGWGVNPNNPRQALKAAARHMAQYVRRYGNYRNALIAYNAGPGRVGHSLPAETRNYIRAILGGSSGGGLTRGGGGGGGSGPRGVPNVHSTVGGDRLSKLIKVMEGFSNPNANLTSIADAYGKATQSPWETMGTPSFGMYGMTGNLGDPSQMNIGNSMLPPNPVQPFQFQSHWKPTSMLTTLKNIQAMRNRIGAPEPGNLANSVGRGPSPRGGGSGHTYPVAARGRIIGTPYKGTHTLGNWQSDNAVDIAVKRGTAARAMANGVIVKVRGSYHGGSSRFDGFQVTIRTKHNRHFYTHLSSANVRAGQHVRAGQIIGRTGAANGVAHLHLGVQHGNPLTILRGLRR
jgi:murein DD-endopeptidase MepM/ murein hydrolase activator NlpD